MLGVRDRSSALVFTVQFNREGWLARRHRVLINGFIMLDLVFKFSAKTSLIFDSCAIVFWREECPLAQ
jgi:hypothetical protein